MKYFQELTIIPDGEISPYFIWGKLYMQLHLALVEAQNAEQRSEIGVSFPGYRCETEGRKPIITLGKSVRLFAHRQEALAALQLNQWMQRLSDYVHIASIKEIDPSKITGHLIVQRVTVLENQDRLTKRYAKRHGITFDEAKKIRQQRYADKHQVSIEEAKYHYENPCADEQLPYISMRSLSSGEHYSLEIRQTKVDNAVIGSFSTYGLSSQTTVPHWEKKRTQ